MTDHLDMMPEGERSDLQSAADAFMRGQVRESLRLFHRVIRGPGSDLAKAYAHKALLVEIDPLYADVIVQRWEEFTGKKAERISAGEVAEVAQ